MTTEPHHTHQPVLYHEIIHFLQPISRGRYIDATVGAGGHAWGILEHSSPGGRLLALDRDPQALELASQRLSDFGDRAVLVHASYTQLKEETRKIGWESVNGILFDLGVSSMQIDTPSRGFSFRSEGPLDMRFNQCQAADAAILVNSLSEKELADLIWRYGEERNARRIARAICLARPLSTTVELAEVIQNAVGRHARIHPATRTFQALRIAVNDELQAVEAALPQSLEILAPGGRLAIISFHSLEDRLVKQFLRRESSDCICPPEQLVCSCGHRAALRELTRRPVMPQEEEIRVNPRARSARLRVAEKIQMA